MSRVQQTQWEDLDPKFKVGRRYRVVQTRSPFEAVLGLAVVVQVEPTDGEDMVIVRVGDAGRVIRLPRSWLQPLVDRAWLEQGTPTPRPGVDGGCPRATDAQQPSKGRRRRRRRGSGAGTSRNHRR